MYFQYGGGRRSHGGAGRSCLPAHPTCPRPNKLKRPNLTPRLHFEDKVFSRTDNNVRIGPIPYMPKLNDLFKLQGFSKKKEQKNLVNPNLVALVFYRLSHSISNYCSCCSISHYQPNNHCCPLYNSKMMTYAYYLQPNHKNLYVHHQYVPCHHPLFYEIGHVL